MFGHGDLHNAFALVDLLENGGPSGGPAYDGPRHFDYKPEPHRGREAACGTPPPPTCAPTCCSRSARRRSAPTPRCRRRSPPRRSPSSPSPRWTRARRYDDLLADRSAYEDFDADAYFDGKGFGFVRLQQLATEHLLGARVAPALTLPHPAVPRSGADSCRRSRIRAASVGTPLHSGVAAPRPLETHDTRRRRRLVDPELQGRHPRRRDRRRSCARAGPRTPTAPRSTRGVVGRAAARRSRTPAASTTSPRSRSAASSTAWSCSTPTGRVIRDALLWNDTRSARPPRDLIDEVGADELARRTGVVPVASFTTTKLRWLRDAEPENAARVAAVALPHDWLTWRLRGFGPAGEAPLGPVLDELDDRPLRRERHGYWTPTTGEYDRELLVRALGHDAVLPRVLGPAERAGRAPDVPHGIVVGRRRRRQRGRRARPRRRSRATSSSRSARAARSSPSPMRRPPTPGHRRRLRRRQRRLPAARRDAQRGARARRRRRPARRRPRRARRASRSPAEPGAPAARARAVLRGRAHAEPPRRDRDPLRHDARLDDPREPRARRHRGDALRPRRRPRRRARSGRRASSGCC